MQLNQELKQKLFSDIQRMAHQLLEIKTPSGIVAQFSQIQSLYEKASYLKMDAEWSTMVPHAKESVAKELATPVLPEVVLPELSPEPSLAVAEIEIIQKPAIVPPLDSEDHLAIKLADFEDDFLKDESIPAAPTQQSSSIENQLPWLKPEEINTSNPAQIEVLEDEILTEVSSEDEAKPEPETLEPAPSIITHQALDLPISQSCETPVKEIMQNVSRETFEDLTHSNTAELNPLPEVLIEDDFSCETPANTSLAAVAEAPQTLAALASPETSAVEVRKEEHDSKFKLSHIKSLSSKPEAVVLPTSTTVSTPSPKAYLFPQKIVLDLNDRLAFEKHLFAHDPGLLKACIDELNQFQSEEGSKQYLSGFLTQNSINLQNEYAQRLFQLIENKFKA